jgi:hypothetical protein
MSNVSVTRAIFILILLIVCAPDRGARSYELLTNEHTSVVVRFAGNTNSDERIELPGFSVSPPRGEYWIEGPRLPEPDPNYHGVQSRLHFVRVLPQNSEVGPHMAFAQVSTMFLSEWDRRLASANVRDFMRFRMKYTMASDKVSAGPRKKLKSQRAELDRSIGYTCFKYDVVVEDRGVKGFPDVPFVSDFHFYECIDPSLKLIVSLYYGQSVHPEAKPVDISREGQKFLKSLKFTSYNTG